MVMSDYNTIRAESDARRKAAFLQKLKRELQHARAQAAHWRGMPESDTWAAHAAYLEREIAARQPC
jgi:hypothetical protein